MKDNKRKNRFRMRITVFGSLVLFCAIIFLGVSVISQSQEERRDRIRSKTEKIETDSGVADEEELKLIEILKKKNESKEAIFMAIQKLGDIRSKAAIPALIEHLDYEKLYISALPRYVNGVRVDGQEIGKTVPLSGRYPAAGALLRIGPPALPSLVGVIENEQLNSVKSRNALYVIDQIFVEDKLKAVLYLEKAMAESTTPAGSRRLNFAARKIEKGFEDPMQ